MAPKAAGKKQYTRKDLERIRSIAEDLYINKGYKTNQICADWDISEQTLIRWKKGRAEEKSWDERRAFTELTPIKLKELLLTEALNISEGKAATFNADSLSKIMTAIEKIDKTVNPRIVTSILMDFDNWMSSIDPKTAMEITKYHRMFILHCTQNEHK